MSANQEATRGTRFLEERGVAFELVAYVYARKGAGRAAQAVGWPEERVIKSLVVQAGRQDFRFALVPTHRDLSLKKLARLIRVKNVQMAGPRDAERLTGYVPGGISPFGSYAALGSVLDESLLEHERVLINAGRRGVLVALSPWDLAELLDALVADLLT